MNSKDVSWHHILLLSLTISCTVRRLRAVAEKNKSSRAEVELELLQRISSNKCMLTCWIEEYPSMQIVELLPLPMPNSMGETPLHEVILRCR